MREGKRAQTAHSIVYYLIQVIRMLNCGNAMLGTMYYRHVVGERPAEESLLPTRPNLADVYFVLTFLGPIAQWIEQLLSKQ